MGDSGSEWTSGLREDLARCGAGLRVCGEGLGVENLGVHDWGFQVWVLEFGVRGMGLGLWCGGRKGKMD